IAPPYDVLSEADKVAMLKRDPNNIVAADLPHTPPKSAGPAEAYRKAADLLQGWLAGGVLVRDSAPAVYPYQQTFEAGGRKITRRGFIARVRAEQFRATPTGIFPHEQTFSGPKEDRLMLTRAARMQLSPIFGLFADDGNAITDSLYANLPAAPTMRGRLGNVAHEAWRVDDPAKVAALTRAMATRPIFIADGHHRYTTALNYLAELEKQGPLPADHPARFVMFVCVSMHDPGLAILPTHRVVTCRPVALSQLAAKLGGVFEVQVGALSVGELEAAVLAKGPGWFGVKSADSADSLLLRLADAKLLDRFEPDRKEAYRRLDVAILHRYLLAEVLGPLAGEPAGIEYPHSGKDTAAALAATKMDSSTAFGTGGAVGGAARTEALTKLAFILAPTPLAAVRDVCLSGELMPQKSTFFYPKLATGLTLYALSE
ncbi:MAG: DUF1015 domain-containing protein, partial [Phycisphaerae bacterium]|nr:DUF1015 domain-containing protein [Phycisphaerae bacterium]